jgi:hypothetical protein
LLPLNAVFYHAGGHYDASRDDTSLSQNTTDLRRLADFCYGNEKAPIHNIIPTTRRISKTTSLHSSPPNPVAKAVAKNPNKTASVL